MICKPPNSEEDEASEPQCRRTDGALLLPEVHLQAFSDRNCHECIWIWKKISLYSMAAAGPVVRLLMMGSAVQHVACKALP